MTVFKIDRIQYVEIVKNFNCPVICLRYPFLAEIFQSDPNYLSLADSKIFYYYKNTKIFEAINGDYRNAMKKINKSLKREQK